MKNRLVVQKIGNPIPGPTEPAPPPPEPYVVPRMIQMPEQPKAVVWRCRETDIEPIMEWLPEKLRGRWPAVDEAPLRFWLKAAMGDRGHLLCRTDKIVALYKTYRDALSPNDPVVSEVFVRSREKSNEEAVVIYRYIQDWAASIGARVMDFNIDSDCPMDAVRPALFDPKREFTVEKRSVYAAILKE